MRSPKGVKLPYYGPNTILDTAPPLQIWTRTNLSQILKYQSL